VDLRALILILFFWIHLLGIITTPCSDSTVCTLALANDLRALYFLAISCEFKFTRAFNHQTILHWPISDVLKNNCQRVTPLRRAISTFCAFWFFFVIYNNLLANFQPQPCPSRPAQSVKIAFLGPPSGLQHNRDNRMSPTRYPWPWFDTTERVIK